MEKEKESVEFFSKIKNVIEKMEKKKNWNYEKMLLKMGDLGNEFLRFVEKGLIWVFSVF